MRWMGAAAVVAAAALVAAGCGGSNEETGTTAEATSAERTVETTTETETEADSTEATTGTESETTSGDLSALSGECRDLVEVSQKFGAAMAAAAGGGAELEETSKLFEGFADQVPDEVKEAFQALAAAFATYADALKDLDLQPGETPTPDQIAKLADAAKALDQQEVTEASARIEAWVTENCGTNP